MERKFRIGLIAKETKRFWWLGVALLAVAALAILVYSFAMYTPTYTVEAQEYVYVKYEPVGENSSFSPNAELANVYKLINAQDMKEKLNALVKKFRPDVSRPETCYNLSFSDNIYTISVTMLKKEDATVIATQYLGMVENIINVERTFNVGSKEFIATKYQEPILKSEVGLTPLKMCIFGFVGAVVIYIIVIFCIFYFNRKLYNDQEFRDNFDAMILEADVRKNGYDNVCIKLAVQSSEREKPYVVALGRKIDANVLARQLMKEGFSVLKTDVQSALSENRELREENGVDVLFGTDGLLRSAEDCKKDLVKNYVYDYILIAAADGGADKSYITAASVADGLILGFDLKSDDYRTVVGVFDELAVVTNLNLLGVVL